MTQVTSQEQIAVLKRKMDQTSIAQITGTETETTLPQGMESQEQSADQPEDRPQRAPGFRF